MSDRLTLTEAMEDPGIERSKAARIATVVFDVIHQNVATKADVQASEASLRGEMQAGFGRLDERLGRQDVAMERLRSTVREIEGRMIVSLGGWLVVLFGLFFAALHAWPTH